MEQTWHEHMWLASDWLLLLDPDPAVASAKYFDLFQGLARYFEWNHGADPEDMAQETLRRGFGRLAGGAPITIDDARGYFWGIAYNVLREGWNRGRTTALGDCDFPVPGSSFRRLNRVEQGIFLRECLSRLKEQDLEALLAQADGRGREWAAAHQLSAGAFRLRVHRLRRQLERLAMEACEKKKKRSQGSDHV